MRTRLLALMAAIIVPVALLAATVVLAQGPAVDPAEAEARREAAAAAALEANPGPQLRAAADFAAPAVITAPLFVGLSNIAAFSYLIDPATGQSYPLFDGFELWGAAYDDANERVFFNRGPTLYTWPLDGAPAALGQIVGGESGANLSMAGLAYHGGVLYASRTLQSAADPEGIYTIDTATLSATLAFTYTAGAGATDIGGLAADPASGALYGTNDQAGQRGLVRLDPNGDMTLVAPYPDGQNDLDGLAIGGGRAYLVADEPGDIFVFDFATLTYTTPITAPWETAELFSGATWIDIDAPPAPAISLVKTVTADVGECGASTTLTIERGQPVLTCFTVTNTGDVALGLHDLVDSHFGTLLTATEQALLPGASLVITHAATLTATMTNMATWTAYNAGPTDIISDTASATVTVIEPEIAVAPSSLAAELHHDETATATLTLSNSGTAPLDWTISFAPADCATPGVLPWVTATPIIGVVASGDANEVAITFDATGQAPGVYDGVLCVTSDDADEPVVSVPLRLAVVPHLVYLPIFARGAGEERNME